MIGMNSSETEVLYCSYTQSIMTWRARPSEFDRCHHVPLEPIKQSCSHMVSYRVLPNLQNGSEATGAWNENIESNAKCLQLTAIHFLFRWCSSLFTGDDRSYDNDDENNERSRTNDYDYRQLIRRGCNKVTRHTRHLGTKWYHLIRLGIQLRVTIDQ